MITKAKLSNRMESTSAFTLTESNGRELMSGATNEASIGDNTSTRDDIGEESPEVAEDSGIGAGAVTTLLRRT